MPWDRWFSTSQFKWLLAGGLFGLAFPVAATGLHLLFHGFPPNIVGIIQSQIDEPILWIVNTAPLFLGLFAWFAGKQRDQLLRLKTDLKSTVSKRTTELQAVNTHLICEMEQRRKIQEAASQGEKERGAIFDAISDQILITDIWGQITHCNRAVSGELAKDQPEIIGQNIGSFLGYASNDQGAPIINGKEVQLANLTGWFDVNTYLILAENGPRERYLYPAKRH